MVTFKQAVALMLTFSGFAAAQVAPTPEQDKKKQEEDLTNLNLEDLVNIKVTTASRKAESLFGVASAISVITAEDLKRSGAPNIPEALRLVPGVNVAQVDAQHYAVSIRGFNGQYASRLLVLVDGRSIYNTLFGGVYWEDQTIAMEDIERIEVIRGPGGSLWGANAVNGIINIITKSAKDTQGVLIAGEAGNAINMANGTIRYGGALGKGHFRVTANGFHKDESETAAGADAGDDWGGGRFSFRYDAGEGTSQRFSLQGSLMRSDLNQMTAVQAGPPPGMGIVSDNVRNEGGFLLAKLSQDHKDGSSTSLQSFFHKERHNLSPTGVARVSTLDFDFQHALAPRGSHNVQFGLNYRTISDDYTSPVNFLSKTKSTFDTGTGFVQDDIQMGSKAKLTLGTKLENNSFTGWEFQPSARLSLTPSEDKTFWFALSRSVQTPNRINQDGDLFISYAPLPGGAFGEVRLIGDRNSIASKVVTAELGHRLKVSDRLTLEATAFHNDYADMSQLVTGTPFVDPAPTPHVVIPQIFTNAGNGKTRGFELGGKLLPANNWKVDFGYSFLDADVPDSISAPKHQFHVLSTMNLGTKLHFDQALYYVGDHVGTSTGSYAKLDLQLRYKHSDMFEFAIGGRNVGGGSHEQFPSDGFTMTNNIKPEVFARATWKF